MLGVRDGEKKGKRGKREQWRTEGTSLRTLKIVRGAQEDRRSLPPSGRKALPGCPLFSG